MTSQPQSPCGAGLDLFNATLDLVEVHYDCAADPDDFESAVADRALLEVSLGSSWLNREGQLLAVAGTFGTNTYYQALPCERVLATVWGDRMQRAEMANPDGRRVATARALALWEEALARGGQIYIKEGGQSDFTAGVLEQLEARQPGRGRCVHVVQHSAWNEKTASPGVLDYLQATVDYAGAAAGSTGGTVRDGNIFFQRGARAGKGTPTGFEAAALASWLGCAWERAFDAYTTLDSWCGGKAHRGARPTDCLDFSDSYELALILGREGLSAEAVLAEFVNATRSHGGEPLAPLVHRTRRSIAVPRHIRAAPAYSYTDLYYDL